MGSIQPGERFFQSTSCGISSPRVEGCVGFVGGIRNRLLERIAHDVGKPLRETLLQLGLQRVVSGKADGLKGVVNPGILSVGAQRLSCRRAKARIGGNNASRYRLRRVEGRIEQTSQAEILERYLGEAVLQVW